MIGELTNHLWQSTLFAVAAGLLTVAFRKNRAAARYWLWFSASFKFFVPFALLMSLGSQLQWAPVAQKIATPAVSFTMVQITQPFPDSLPMAPSTQGTRNWVPLAILGVWACGFAGVALIRFRGLLRIRDAVRASKPIDIPATVEVRSSPGLLEPGVVGLWRPILLLPAGIAERLTPPQLEAVLVHELCHVQRRDNLTSAIHMIVEAVFWFHPLVWWIGARLIDEREQACDEEVLRLGSEPQVYAEGILNVCKLYVESPLVCVSGVTGSNLKKRIETIMTNRVVLRLSFAKKVALVAAGMVALTVPIVVGIVNAPSIRAQSQTPKFEVASIRPSNDCGGPIGGKNGKKALGRPAPSPGRLNTCGTVMDLIRVAYIGFANGRNHPPGHEFPISGGPAWINSDRYQINAKAEGTPSQAMMRGPMLQALLEDRFSLKIHRETREVPVYALTVAKGGPKLLPSKEGCITPEPMTRGAPGQKLCGSPMMRTKGPNMMVDLHGSPDELSKFLGATLRRPVIDKTGITERFDFHLEFALDEAAHNFLLDGVPGPPPALPSDDPAGPSIFTAVQKQLGLKLESAKGPGEFLVIDDVEKPTEN